MTTMPADLSTRAELTAPINYEALLAAQQAEREAISTQASFEQPIVFVSGLANNARRNSLNSVTTRRRSSIAKRKDSITPSDDDVLGGLLKHLRLDEPEQPSARKPATPSSRPTTPHRPMASASASGSKRSSMSSAQVASVVSAAVAPAPTTEVTSPSPSAPSPSRARGALPPRRPSNPSSSASSSSHALPSVEHLRATPLNYEEAPRPPHPDVHDSPSPSSLPPLAPSTPLTRRSSMPCQSVGAVSRFWSDTRSSELRGSRGSGLTPGGSKEQLDSARGKEATEEEAPETLQLTRKGERRRDVLGEAEEEGSCDAPVLVAKTAADPMYAWLPIGCHIMVEQ